MHYYVNVSFANIYRKPTFHGEVDTQAVLWEKLEMLEKIDPFLRVETEDGYEGWINEHQVSCCGKPGEQRKMITAPRCDFFEQPDSGSQIVRHGGAGSKIPVLEEQNGWIKTRFPDEKEGWIHSDCFEPLPQFTRDNFVEYISRFLGTTYVWGGKTPYGLDCSGFVQLAFKLFGKNIRRDAWMQFEDAVKISSDPLKADKGDLYFFAETGEKITHVGIALGNGHFIHARGMVRINSLVESDPNFSPELLKDFVEVRTFF